MHSRINSYRNKFLSLFYFLTFIFPHSFKELDAICAKKNIKDKSVREAVPSCQLVNSSMYTDGALHHFLASVV